jgi:hypothetical protein
MKATPAVGNFIRQWTFEELEELFSNGEIVVKFYFFPVTIVFFLFAFRGLYLGDGIGISYMKLLTISVVRSKLW